MNPEKIVETMEREALKRCAPVYKLKNRLSDPFKILVGAILSTRTRDEETLKALERLFSEIKDPKDLAKMDVKSIEELIKNVGFYRVKARKLKELAEVIVKEYNSKIPENFRELLNLPGVGRKVANVFLTEMGYDTIAVDTHVHRIANRLGIVKAKSVEETEEELKKIFPRSLWRRVNRAFVGFGQTVCKPQKPLCSECPLSELCKKVGVDAKTSMHSSAESLQRG
ncbi:MAG: endonuclease III [Archaeoglobaceae archaeon]